MEKAKQAAVAGEVSALDGVVAQLRHINRGPGLRRTLAVGELVLSALFAGDAERWHDRRRNKSDSVRRLAKTRGCPFSKSALNEAVSVFVAASALPGVERFRHVQASHVVAVLTLAASERKLLLEQAEQAAWSVRRLRQEVASRRRFLFRANSEPEAKAAVNKLRNALDEFAEAARRVSDSTRPHAVEGSLLGDAAREVTRLTERLTELGSSYSGPGVQPVKAGDVRKARSS